MPSFYIPNRYRSSEELGAYLLGCSDGIRGVVDQPNFAGSIYELDAYKEGYKKGASLRELDL